MLFVFCTLTCALIGVPVAADEPPKKVTPEERKALLAEARELNLAALKQRKEGRLAEAEKTFTKLLTIARRLYPKDDFSPSHVDLAGTLKNLAGVILEQKRPAEAEPLFREELALRRRLNEGNHPFTARCLNDLAHALAMQQKLAEAETLLREDLAMRRELFKDKDGHPAIAQSTSDLGIVLTSQGKPAEAERLYREAVAMWKRVLKDNDHRDLAAALNNLAIALNGRGKLAESEQIHREALEMRKRLFKGDHPDVAVSLANLAVVVHEQGKLAESERTHRAALEMRKRLFKGDDPDVAISLNNLATVLRDAGKTADAEQPLREALEMRKRLFKGDHPDVAVSLGNLAVVLADQKKFAEAERLHRSVLEMRKRIHKGDHPDVSNALCNLAFALGSQGRPAEAEELLSAAVKMQQRLFNDDRPTTAIYLNNLALALAVQKKFADAESGFRDALAMSRRLVVADARLKSEGEALTQLAALPPSRDAFLSVARTRNTDPGAVYAEIWASKAAIGRVFEQRCLAARTTTEPEAAKSLVALSDARRFRANLLVAPVAPDPATRKKREADLRELDDTIAKLDGRLRARFPVIERTEKLERASPADLRAKLPADTAVVDFLRYKLVSWDPTKRVADGWLTESYLAFVVTAHEVSWVDLGPAGPIEKAVAAWREGIEGGKVIPDALPAEVRELVWAKVERTLPVRVKVVYVSPDMALCRVPWAALPGARPGTILLDDYAVATIPHAQFLLDKLGPEGANARLAGALVVGGVKYDAAVPPAPGATGGHRDAPVKPGGKLAWAFLPGTVAEADGVAAVAGRKKLTVRRLAGEAATADAILSALPKARCAHLATHGFFADPSFRSVLQLAPEDFETTLRGERRGRASLNPLVMTGLVFAGANTPQTPGRGILTGESLIDLDLSGLELVVLSACETGIGDVAGGEGTFGLQRAFHMAGARDVVASLWKVPDTSTAALMALFYRNLWDKNLAPVEALRQAQLELYNNPAKIPELAKGFRGKFEEVPSAAAADVKPTKDGKAHPLLWAAFTLSGPGR